nr:uncharacterized protein LOC119180907 [Rhipicephalus microplus]
MGKITNRPQADTSNLPSGYITKGAPVPLGQDTSVVKGEHYGRHSGQPVNHNPVPYRELPYSELSELASALCEQSTGWSPISARLIVPWTLPTSTKILCLLLYETLPRIVAVSCRSPTQCWCACFT